MTASAGADSSLTRDWQNQYQVMQATWRSLASRAHARDAGLVAGWEDAWQQMSELESEHISLGRWRGGPHTLLGALNVEHLELVMTAGLAWLLRPDGHHGLGDAMLTALASRLGIRSFSGWHRARVVLEEQREQTRADLLVYGPGWTIVVESKTFAVEQHEQLDRLHRHWQDEDDPHFVFLTRGDRLPSSAVVSSQAWQQLTWTEVARLASAAANGRRRVAPGVHEYIATLEAYYRV